MWIPDKETLKEQNARSKTMMEQRRARERKQYLRDHRFDIINSCIAILALIVAVFGLFLPRAG